MKKLVILAGPTGVGKTEISLALAERIHGEIVSCDSMQIYQGMDIGSAKATTAEQKRVPHHLLDVVSPFEPFTVSDYKRLAEEAIDDILDRGHVPIMVGGTGLYIDAVIKDLSFTEGGSDEVFRKEMEKLATLAGNQAVHEKLQRVDEEAAEKIHPNNLKRVIRALEVYHVTGKPFSSFKDQHKKNPKYDAQYFYLNKDRQKLYEDIDQRVMVMKEAGLLEEVQKLQQQGLHEGYTSMKGIGYKEILAYLDGRITLEGALELIKKRSRNYAKRQLTWFRHQDMARELHKDKLSSLEIIKIIENALM